MTEQTVEKKEASAVVKKGLQGVVAADSEICSIDGEKGELIYRGFNIDDLAGKVSFEEVIFFLWFDRLPTSQELESWSQEIASKRELPAPVLELVKQAPADAAPMAVLRSAVSALAMYDPEPDSLEREALLVRARRIVAAVPVIVATFQRHRRGLTTAPPRTDLGHSANFLYMLRGEEVSQAEADALDMYLVLLAEHGLNASTFAARTTAGTLADLYSAIVSAIGTLKGDLHGAANRRTMEMLLEIGDLDSIEAYVKQKLADGQRIMGFGHRVYKVRDPRAFHLDPLSQRLGEVTGDSKWHDMSKQLEDVVHGLKGLYPNVDFYSASVLYYLGIPVDLFTTIFAMSRTGGWIAHVLEQYADNRLIRPRARYVGPTDRTFVPIEERG